MKRTKKIVGSSVENPHVEAGMNTTTVDLQVIGGDKKGAQCLGI
jgi:hypothetical protein